MRAAALQSVLFAAAVLVCAAPRLAIAADPPAAGGATSEVKSVTETGGTSDDPAHDDLRKLRDAILAAYEKEDVDAMLGHLHPNVVVTWQNGEVSRGPKGVRQFYERMMKGDKPVVSSIKSKVVIDELAILHGGDTAIAFGGLSDDYALTSGMNFHLDSRFTATAVKEGDRWVLASYHASAGLFDNPLLNAAKKAIPKTGMFGAGGGLIAGLVLGVVMMRKKKG